MTTCCPNLLNCLPYSQTKVRSILTNAPISKNRESFRICNVLLQNQLDNSLKKVLEDLPEIVAFQSVSLDDEEVILNQLKESYPYLVYGAEIDSYFPGRADLLICSQFPVLQTTFHKFTDYFTCYGFIHVKLQFLDLIVTQLMPCHSKMGEFYCFKQIEEILDYLKEKKLNNVLLMGDFSIKDYFSQVYQLLGDEFRELDESLANNVVKGPQEFPDYYDDKRQSQLYLSRMSMYDLTNLKEEGNLIQGRVVLTCNV